MLEELIKSRKISVSDAEEYQLFCATEAGRKWLMNKTHETFMDEVPKDVMTGTAIAFVDGRRSILRELHFTIEHVQNHIREYQNDGNSK